MRRSLLRVIRLPRFFMAGAVFALLVWWASIGPAFAADDFARVSALVDRASAASGKERDTLVADALSELEAHPAFDEKAWLEEPLRANPPDLPLAQARLAREAEASATGPAGFIPNDDPRASLNQVLADARFHPRSWQDDVPTILLPLALVAIAIVNFLWSIIRWPFDRLFELLIAFVTSRAFGPITAVGAVAVVVAVVTLYRRGLTAILVRQAEIATDRDDLPLTAADALAAARREDGLARYREACHFVLFATLLWIEEKGIARFDRSATNREHLDQLVDVASLPDRRLVGALEPVINRFDRVWYGQPFATVDDYRDLLALAGRVRDALT